MSKSIVLRWHGEESAFSFRKLERERLYGKKQKLVVDEHGNAASSAYLTQDGAALVPQGGIAQLYVDAAWNAYESETRIAVNEDGAPIPTLPSTLGVAQEAHAAEATRLLDCAIDAVYQLDPETLTDRVRSALEQGTFLELPFSYRGGQMNEPMFLLHNEEGYFALLGRETRFEYLRHELPPSADFDEDELDDELDFSTM